MGTKENLWVIKTPLGISKDVARDKTADPAAFGCMVGKIKWRYHLCCLVEFQEKLKAHSDWMSLTSADEVKPASEGTVEAWGRSPENRSVIGTA